MERRQFLHGALGLVAAATVAPARASAPYDVIVSVAPRDEGRARTFSTVAAAIAAAPLDGTAPYRILLSRGSWREKIIVDVPNIHLFGEDRAQSILRFDAAAGDIGPDGKPWGTWGCATLTVRAPGFRASRLTVMNGFDYVGHLQKPVLQAIGSNGPQAVALMLDAGADRTVFDRVDILGHQDTLFADAGRSVFRRCRITGSVDFIFGAGNAVFDRCELVSRFRPGKERQGYIAAPSTPAAQAAGLSFVDCRLTREREVPDDSVALGRAWRPTRHFPDGDYGDPGVVGQAAFVRCWMDRHIASDGWDPMNYTQRGGERVALAPVDARLFEYRSRGPGAGAPDTRRQLDAAAAAATDRLRDIHDW